jgi:hypothetical protein
MTRQAPKKWLFALYLAVLILVLPEIAVRISGYSEHHLCDPIYQPFEGTPDIPYVHKPNLSRARARGLALINTDAIGLRSVTTGGECAPKKAREYRIALVGDSVTFGEGVVRTEDTFAQVLEETLNRKQSAPRARVLNFGASAYSVKVMAATLNSRMLKVEPDLVLMAIIPSDFDLSRTPSVDAGGNLSDNKLSGFLPRDTFIRPLLRKVHLVYLLRDFIYPYFDKSKKAEPVLAAGEMPESYPYLKAFKETAERKKVPYRIVLLPSLKIRFGNIASRLEVDALSFVDLETLRDRFTQDQFRASKFDPHPSAMVHRAIGESLAEHILANHLMERE